MILRQLRLIQYNWDCGLITFLLIKVCMPQIYSRTYRCILCSNPSTI
nr:MAG TPA: hypothetical protein [Crassvirales sp.]